MQYFLFFPHSTYLDLANSTLACLRVCHPPLSSRSQEMDIVHHSRCWPPQVSSSSSAFNKDVSARLWFYSWKCLGLHLGSGFELYTNRDIFSTSLLGGDEETASEGRFSVHSNVNPFLFIKPLFMVKHKCFWIWAVISQYTFYRHIFFYYLLSPHSKIQ